MCLREHSVRRTAASASCSTYITVIDRVVENSFVELTNLLAKVLVDVVYSYSETGESLSGAIHLLVQCLYLRLYTIETTVQTSETGSETNLLVAVARPHVSYKTDNDDRSDHPQGRVSAPSFTIPVRKLLQSSSILKFHSHNN